MNRTGDGRMSKLMPELYKEQQHKDAQVSRVVRVTGARTREPPPSRHSAVLLIGAYISAIFLDIILLEYICALNISKKFQGNSQITHNFIFERL